MKSLWTARGLYLAALTLCLLFCATSRAATPEESTDGRVRLYVKAWDPNGGKLSFSWKQLEGPTVRLNDPVACATLNEDGKIKYVSDTFFIATEPGSYKFEVTIRGDGGQESKKVFQREVLPPTPPPVAVVGKDKSDIVLGQKVLLNGSDSHAAPERNITEWEWTVLQKPEKFKLDPRNLKERQFEFKAELPGVYQFQLRVFDGKRWSEPAALRVTVKPAAAPLVVDVNDEQQKVELPAVQNPLVAEPVVTIKAVAGPGRTVQVGDTLVLDGSASVADEKLKPCFIWEQQSGPMAKTLAPDKSRPFTKGRPDLLNYPVWLYKTVEPGDYVFTLRVECSDAHGQTLKAESDPVTFKVVASNNPPTAKIFAERTEVEVGDLVTLDGSKSSDPDGDKLADTGYLWGPVEGKRYPRDWAGVAGPKVQFRAAEEGEYSVSLVVSDGKASSKPAQVAIVVRPADKPPVIELAKTYEIAIDGKLRIEAKITDPESDPVSVKWSCVDPDYIQIPEELAHNPVLIFIPRKPGAYVFKVVATDAKGHQAEAQTMVGVKPANEQPPTAVITGPEAAKAGTRVVLSGERSTSFPEGKALTYTWAQVEGPAVQLQPSEKNKGKTCEVAVAEAGRYVFSLVAADGARKSEPERFELTVTRDNTAPTARIDAPKSGKATIGIPLVLDGSGSADPEKDKLTFKWRKAGGTAEVQLSGEDQDRCTLTATTPGTIQIELVVNDGQLDSQPAKLELAAVPPRGKPVAKITGPETAKAGAAVVLSAAESSSPDGTEINAFIWSQSTEDGGPEIGVRGRDMRKRELQFKPEKPGVYVVKLKVTDAEGLESETVTHKVEVKGVNHPPRAEASLLDPGPFAPGKEVKLSARGSLDPEGGALTYKWKQTAGPALTFPQESSDILNVVPAEAGDYEFQLVVNDGESDSVPAKVLFSVKAPNHPPVAAIAPLTPCEPGGKITLDATGSKDEDGDKLDEYRWTRISGPDVSFGMRGDKRPKLEVTLPKEGEYVFELKVFDGKEWSEPVRAAVKTLPPNVPPEAAFEKAVVQTEEGSETVLDASASHDSDNGPQPLKFSWRCSDSKVELQGEGPVVRFTPHRAGTLIFQVRVSDGKAESRPAELRVLVLKKGTLPVGVAIAKPNPVKLAHKGAKNGPVLILDATQSQPGNAAGPKAAMTYVWRQVAGEDLNLRPEELAKNYFGLRVFIPGNYRFSLTVSDGQNTSVPVFVDFQVIDETAQPAAEKKAAPEKKTPEGPAPQSSAPSKTSAAAPRLAGNEPARDPDGATLLPPREVRARADANATPEEKRLAALAADEDPAAERKLVAALSSSDGEVRATAAVALYRRGINSIPALIEVLDKGDDNARNAAYGALKDLTRESLALDAGQWRNWWAGQPVSKQNLTLAVPR